jgi:hypothetical protein
MSTEMASQCVSERHVRVNLHEPLFTVPQFTAKVPAAHGPSDSVFIVNDANLIALVNGLPKPVSVKLLTIVVGSDGDHGEIGQYVDRHSL